jgi:hypothetical protein
LDEVEKALDKLDNGEDSLRSKIIERKLEPKGQSKKLMSVHKTRPALMDEYKWLENELQKAENPLPED